LVNPALPDGFWSFSWVFRHIIKHRSTVNPPLGLATIAALTPAGWNVRIIDENIEPIPFDQEADVVAVGGMSVQHPRQMEILERFRRHGYFVVAGGSFAALCPEAYEGKVDTIVVGEAETLWPAFCADFTAGQPKPLYRNEGDTDLRLSPTPRHDLLNYREYLTGSIQFSRGCPFQCEFCDIIVTFGRRPRVKTIAQIERELDALRRQAVRNVVFVDDNLIGHPAECARLLRFLIDYQERHRYRFVFGAETSLNVAGKPEILELLRRASFAWLFIGIESPDPAALKETRKFQNLRGDALESIRKIYAAGIDVFAGFIVGFDADDETIFERQKEFILESGIIVAMIGMLMAPPRTPLYARLQREGRLVSEELDGDTLINAGLATNIIPKKMTGRQLYEGTAALHRSLLDDRAIYLRLVNKMGQLGRAPNYAFRFTEWAGIAWGLMRHGIFPGGPRRWCYFLASILAAARRPFCFASLFGTLVANWSYALSLRDYADRRLGARRERTQMAAVGAPLAKPFVQPHAGL
jgi:radical SAM superfamily enzyme YgiQ (UPF0313 family)